MHSRNKEWVYVILTCFFELSWVLGFTIATEFWHWIIIVLVIIVDFTCLTKACKTIPTGTVYAIFSGVGAIGSVAIDVLLFGQTFNLLQLFFVLLIIIGVVQLKRTDS
ncbi:MULTISPECIES: DMT family transporter [unclassified Gilliamella]|uniref:DMT family transporter n=1 Tax=unclassified Gilliamella TaxID=2685620 RepID=UPI001C69C986|nr:MULTISPECIES: SMR family transporter [unclassified Gilliamella]MCX8600807.1 hypothetical protein [Gilliamella sp. B3722]MCX8609068.1 hypothetical protein [Gilliamella sp. B3771]MCX8610027.1 hypothetical protein [Gilliamella sp. B3891]MCX8612713.1 hypothetical protein [Gilliamella sp. B3773]MCX8616640.1 hypothetical protein [Gilliamella sp. B3770]